MTARRGIFTDVRRISALESWGEPRSLPSAEEKRGVNHLTPKGALPLLHLTRAIRSLVMPCQ